MWVKICGTTTAEDARMAAEAGADAVGFVLAAGSRRRVTLDTVAGISAELAANFPQVERIGVFDSGETGQIVGGARASGLTGVQLHGGGGVALARAVGALARELTVIPVVHWQVGSAETGKQVREQIGQMQTVGMRRVLLDSKVGAETGGLGVQFAWQEAAPALESVRDGVDLVVAGGLRPETVGEAIRVLKPWGVDVASGVEREVGRKSAERVAEFIANARSSQVPE